MYETQDQRGHRQKEEIRCSVLKGGKENVAWDIVKHSKQFPKA